MTETCKFNKVSEAQLILVFSTNPFIFCIVRRFGRRLQPIFRQFVYLINHNKYNDTLEEISVIAC